MKCNITKDGVLEIKAQSEIECYALTMWSKEVMKLSENINESINGVYMIDGSKILVHASVD